MAVSLNHRLRTGYARFVTRASEPVDIAWLVVLRVLFGLVMVVSMVRFLAYGWVDRLFTEPHFHFKYYAFEWVQVLPAPFMHVLFAGLALLALCVAAGLYFRVSAWLLALGLSYFQLIDVSTYLNHYYLAALFAYLLAVTPAHRAGSLDALRARARGHSASPQVARGVMWLLRFQVATVYVGAGLAKAQSDWLLHAQPLRIWLGVHTEVPLVGPLFTWPAVALVASWAGFLFDLTIVLWLSLPRTRPFAYALVIVFHAMTRLLFPIGMFPLIMTTLALVFFPPTWPRTALAWLSVRLRFLGRLRRVQLWSALPSVCASPHAPARRARTLTALGLAYCVLQAVLPMRCLAYGGNVLWHEQGMRFSWRVMVRAKGGSTEFEVRSKRSGERLYVPPRRYLTGMQEMEMSSQPDLILQLAHHIAEDWRRRGRGDIEVRAVSRASLNGRRSAPLIDPNVDLTGVRDGIARADWILPAPAGAPPHTQPVP